MGQRGLPDRMQPCDACKVYCRRKASKLGEDHYMYCTATVYCTVSASADFDPVDVYTA